MKKIINKTNQYLLENHPTIWNTKIVWVLLSALALHLIFFVFGFIALTNAKILHEIDAKSIFFKNGTVFISVILSILLIVVWLIYLFKNNAFKSFYPTTRLKLFKLFICYIIIIFCSSSFYLSYNQGLKSYISYKHSDDLLSKEIEISNDAALFFSINLDDYTIDQRRHPYPFNKLYCQMYQGSFVDFRANNGLNVYDTNLASSQIDSLKPHLEFLDTKYYFYTLYTKEGTLNQGVTDSTYRGFVFYKIKDTIKTYYYKDSIFDVSKYVKSANPTYYNFSKIFYTPRKQELNVIENYNEYTEYESYIGNQNNTNFSIENEIRNKKNSELLNRNNPEEIRKVLNDFLTIANKHEIKHNLTLEKWFNLVYHPNDFELKSLIKGEKDIDFEYPLKAAENANNSFYENHITDYYLENDALYNTFQNIEDIKASTPYLDGIDFFIWFSFFFSSIILMFRVTDLKILLFTIISIGVLTLFITLLTVLYAYIIDFNNENTGFFISYLTLFIGTIILSIPIFFSKKIKKIIVGICLNISIIGFILYIFLIITIISLHQSAICRENNIYIGDTDCYTLYNSLGFIWSYVLFVINLIFIYFYTAFIKNWKALPEG
jgi:hypothetical protein